MCEYTNIKEMITDVRQMFKNCSTYDETSSNIYKIGEFYKMNFMEFYNKKTSTK